MKVMSMAVTLTVMVTVISVLMMQIEESCDDDVDSNDDHYNDDDLGDDDSNDDDHGPGSKKVRDHACFSQLDKSSNLKIVSCQ